MSWYAKRFADGRIALRPNGGMKEFTDVFQAFAKTKPGAALFCRFDEDDGSTTVYLSPDAAEFAAMIRACASDPPAPDDHTMLLVG